MPPAEHTVPAVGFAVSSELSGSGAWVFTGDTGPNPALWRRLTGMRIAHLVIETAFSDGQQLVRLRTHLCPTTLARELVQLDGEAQNVDQIESQTMRHSASALHGGRVFAL